MEYLQSNGYDCREGGVTKNTKVLLVPYAGYSSSKTTSVPRDCRIIPIDQFRQDPIGIIKQIAHCDLEYGL